jgi:hypothetical protein
MRTRKLVLLLLGLAAARADERKPVFPGADWEHVASPEAAGFSSAKLDVLRAWMKTQSTTAMMVSVGGRVLFEYGAVKQVSTLASARKSVLGMRYGKYLGNDPIMGTITLNRTVKDLGLDDVQKFLPIEENATLRDLLMSRSGIYHPGGEEEPKDTCPIRGSQFPSVFFCYNNWDFDAAGTAFEKLAGKNIYDALESDLARPIGMQDFERTRQKKDPAMPYSVHPLYQMYLSTRDMARLGLLMLRGGNWDDKQLINANWVQYMTTLVTPVNELFPSVFRNEAERNDWRFGFGVMWWVWDLPRLPSPIASGNFYGAYSAWGLGGQFITVLPAYDMVVAHKVDLDNVREEKYVTAQEFRTILDMLFSSYCGKNCQSSH